MVRKFISLMSMVLVVATVAFADKLPPNLSTFPVAGESEFFDPPPPPTGYSGNVDWLVLAPGDYTGTIYEPFVIHIFGSPVAPEYVYLYQVEGRANFNNSFTIYVTGPYTSGGTFTAPLDLDTVHNSDNPDFPYLAGEGEPTVSPPLPLVNPNEFTISGNLFQWLWYSGNRLDENEESYILYITSPAPPMYGYATLDDTYSGYTYTIAVPSPEPASFVLLLLGAVASGIILRRKTK